MRAASRADQTCGVTIGDAGSACEKSRAPSFQDVCLLSESRILAQQRRAAVTKAAAEKSKGAGPWRAAPFEVRTFAPRAQAAWALELARASGAGSGSGAVFHFLSSGITYSAKHFMLRSASSNGIPA